MSKVVYLSAWRKRRRNRYHEAAVAGLILITTLFGSLLALSLIIKG